MAFEVVEIGQGIYHLQSGANSGLITHGDRAILIDSGLDDDAGRRIKKAIESLGVKLSAVILTHGHADHFGGTSYLRRNLPPFGVFAPPIEAAFIANPTLEGIMLSAGALPLDQFKSKFTLAPVCKVDCELSLGVQTIADIEVEIVPLAGHSPNQIGVRYHGVLFSADAFLPVATLAKYPVPFTVHIGRALDVLAELDAMDDILIAPGHGVHLPQPGEVILANVSALNAVVDATENALRSRPIDDSEATREVCRRLGNALTTPIAYGLARTTVQAALTYLYEKEQAVIGDGGVWVLK